MKKLFAILIIISFLFVSCGISLAYMAEEPSTEHERIDAKAPSISISEESVIYESGDIRITEKGIDNDNGITSLKLLVENDTGTNITVCGTTFIVNGIMIDTFMYIDVASGKKSNSGIYFDNAELRKAGIEQFVTVQAYDAHISYPDPDKETDYIDLCISYPISDLYIQSIDETGNVLYNQNGITIISKLENGEYADTIPILIKNDSGKDLAFLTNFVSVNGYTVSEWKFYKTVCDGTARFYDIQLVENSLRNNGIEQIENATFSIDFMEPDSTETLFRTGTLKTESAS